MEELIKVTGLTKSYKNSPAVSNLSFSVKKGEILGLLGPNGAGKSTTINILATVLKPDSGNVSICGYNLKNEKNNIKQHLGIVPQDLAIYEEISAEKNVSFFASLYGLRGQKLKERTAFALDLVGLADKRKSKPKTFSGGMKRRLNIACAIAHDPQIIIMDEPTVGIDPQSRNHILESILKLKEHGVSILYSTHYMEEVEHIADRILVAGLLQPTSGTIKVFGMSMLTDRNRVLKKMGCLIESPVFFEQMSAEENLKIHLAYMGVSGLNISSVLAHVGLDNIGNLPVSKFSLGMKQRLAIARSIIHEPELLLLDEPINGLDPVGIKEIRDLFCRLSKEYGMTIVISSHILSEIEQIADTIGIIEKGEIIKETEQLHSQDGIENLEQYFLETLKGGRNIDT